MKKIAIAFLSATLLASTTLAASRVIATYSGTDVTEDQVMEQFKPILETQPANKGKKFQDLDKNTQEALVKGYINVKLINKEIEKSDIAKSKSFQEKMKLVEQQMLQQEFVAQYLKTAVTDKMIDAEYKKAVDSLKGQKEYKVSHILVDTEEKAKNIKKKLNKGSKFDAMVKEYSADEGSKANNGEIGYVVKGQLVKEFEDKAFSMKANEVSDPVKTQFGWHIIKVLDIRNVEVPTKEQAMPSIRAKLDREAIEAYFKKLSDNAKVQIKL